MKDSGKIPGMQGVRNVADELWEQREAEARSRASHLGPPAVFPQSPWCGTWTLSVEARRTLGKYRGAAFLQTGSTESSSKVKEGDKVSLSGFYLLFLCPAQVGNRPLVVAEQI